MPIQGEYMGMMLTIDDVDKENREFFRHCAEGTFHLQKGKESGLLRYPPTTACPWTRDREYEWVPVEGKGTVHSYGLTLIPRKANRRNMKRFASRVIY